MTQHTLPFAAKLAIVSAPRNSDALAPRVVCRRSGRDRVALFDQFDSWKPSDFEAFEASKWRSNRFNVPRGQVRDRLKSLLEQSLARSGADWSALELWTSRPEPNFFNGHEVRDQWALLVRPEAERARIEVVQGAVTAARPEVHHAHLGVQVDAAGVRGWLRVPREAGWDQPGWRAQVALLSMLAGVEPLHLELDGQRAEPGALEAAAADPTPREVGIVWAQTVDDALAGGGGLDDLAMWLSGALPVLQAILVAAPAAAAAAPAPVEAASEASTPSVAAPSAPPPAASQAEARPWQRYRPPPVERKERPVSQGPAAAERLVPPALRAALERELREEEARQRAAEEARLRAHEEIRRREAAWRERQQYPRPAPPAVGRPGYDRPMPDRTAQPPAADQPQRPQQPYGQRPVDDRGGQRWDNRQDPRRDAPGGQGNRPADRGAHGGHHGGSHGAHPAGQQGGQHGGFQGGRGRPYEVRDAAPAPAITTLGPGAKVALTSGLFAGKTGTVSALHGDQAQVLLGLLSVRVPVASLQLT